MAIANWNSRYETGIKVIDDQHRSLFGAVNRRAASFRAGTAGPQARASLDFLGQYAGEPFVAEERYMREYVNFVKAGNRT